MTASGSASFWRGAGDVVNALNSGSWYAKLTLSARSESERRDLSAQIVRDRNNGNWLGRLLAAASCVFSCGCDDIDPNDQGASVRIKQDQFWAVRMPVLSGDVLTDQCVNSAGKDIDCC